MEAVLLAAGLIAYNNLANLWGPFNQALYVPLNLMATFLVALLALGPLGLGASEIGIGDVDAGAIALGAIGGLVVTAPLFLAVASGLGLTVIADERVRRLSAYSLGYQVLVRIPIGTALLEEFAFRGVLPAAWPGSTAASAIAASVAFGLWHIAPTMNLVRANRPDAPRAVYVRAGVGAVLFTTVVGLLLYWIRDRTGGLEAPWALHAVVNSLATIAAVAAHRRRGG